MIFNGYKVEYKQGEFDNNLHDIALLRLRKSIEFSDVVSPACLNLDRNEEDHDVKLIVSGWGRTEERELNISIQPYRLRITHFLFL